MNSCRPVNAKAPNKGAKIKSWQIFSIPAVTGSGNRPVNAGMNTQGPNPKRMINTTINGKNVFMIFLL